MKRIPTIFYTALLLLIFSVFCKPAAYAGYSVFSLSTSQQMSGNDISNSADPSKDSSFIRFEDGKMILDNGIVRRVVQYAGEQNAVRTTQFQFSDEDFDYMDGGQPTYEFRFKVFNIDLSGQNQWEFVESGVEEAESGAEEAWLLFNGYGIMSEISVKIIYTIYPDFPVIKKQLTVSNRGEQDIMLEGVDVEALTLKAFPTDTEVYNQYARNKHIGPYTGDWNDPLLALHFPGNNRGVVIGNEAPGVVKRISYYEGDRDLCAGLTYPDQDFPFRKWLEPGASFTSPAVFVMLYRDEKSPYTALNFTLPDYVRSHMDLKIYKDAYKPVFVYNTWNPFRKEIDEMLVAELAEAAGECGIREFVIDDGWQVNEFTNLETDLPWWYTQVGDYITDRNKFPHGLGPVFGKIREEGMKPGLWLSIGSASNTSAVFREHPEWFVKDAQGQLTNLHEPSNESMYTACMTTGWSDHIRDVILDLEKEHGLSYTKLDFAVVTSAYTSDPSISGCYAEDHPGHRDHPESLLQNYKALFKLFDEIKEEAPELFIDCTFETEGKLHLVDYAFLKHAEGNWLSNIEESPPAGALRVRHLAWQRTPVIPAASLVVGNLRIDSDNLRFDFFSLLGTFPIMLGDIRQVSDENRAWLLRWADWIEETQAKHDFLSFRQDLVGFGEPAEGQWDGWQRINTETGSGGIVGIFRQGSAESVRTVTIEGLDDAEAYNVISSAGGAMIGTYTGKELRLQGFEVKMDRLYQGRIFEIEKALE